jgi:hypothetical protein
MTMTKPLRLLIIAPGILSLLLLLSPSATAFSLDRRRQQCSTSSASFHLLPRYLSSHDRRQKNNIILHNNHRNQYQHRSSSSAAAATSLSLVIGAGAASLIAGSLGGAIGVGVAYPVRYFRDANVSSYKK